MGSRSPEGGQEDNEMDPRYMPGPRGRIFYSDRAFGGAQILHIILAAVIVAALVTLIVWLIAHMRHHDGHPSHGQPAFAPPAADGAIREARMRYARGAMTREQFLQVASDLGDTHPFETVPAAPPAPPPQEG